MDAPVSRSQRSSFILVVDPDSDTRSLYRNRFGTSRVSSWWKQLTGERHSCEPSPRPAVVVTETRLPVFDGYALCDILRRDALTRAATIVVVTGESRASELERLRAGEAARVLVKLAPIEAIVAEINRLLSPPQATQTADVAATSTQVSSVG